MLTLKDIKISKNRIPVQNAIWLRPVGGLKFKIYYPHGGDWTEMEIVDTPEPTPTPEPEPSPEYEAMEEEIQELQTAVSKLKNSISSLTSKLTTVEQAAKEGQVNAYAAYVNSEESENSNQIIMAPNRCTSVSGDNLPLYNITEEILDALYTLASSNPSPFLMTNVRMYRTELTMPRNYVLKTFIMSYTEKGSTWSSITFTELMVNMNDPKETITITREQKGTDILNKPVYYYTIKITTTAPNIVTTDDETSTP